MILENPYSARNLKLFNTKNIEKEINKYITIDYTYIKTKEKIKINPFEGNDVVLNPVFLYGMTTSERDVTPFNHPLISVDHKWIACDLRNLVRVTDEGNSYEIRNQSEFTLTMMRFILSGLWYTGKTSSLYSLELAHFTFASWLSDNLATKFGLELHDKIRLRTLAAIYYFKQFHNVHSDDHLDLLKIRAKKDLIVPEIVEEIYNLVPNLETVEDFCKACFTVTNNVRLEGLDYIVLCNILSNNWLGQHGKELSLLALEHPPTWISLVYAAVTQRLYKRSFIGTIVEKHGKRGRAEDFTKEIEALVKANVEGWL